jgi:two-component system, NtrC family, sensor kinase
MILDFIVAIFIVRYLKKSLQTVEKLPVWDKILNWIFIVSLIFMVLSVVADNARPVMEWAAHALLLFLLYILYTKEEFKPARSYMIAIAPYVLVSLVIALIKLFFNEFYNKWNNYLDPAEFFSVVWLVAMLIINKRQQKALEKEKLKTKEEEAQNKIMVKLKAELEIQVAERTAEITLQKETLQHALDELKSTQAQLIQSEKMASLGELTAGIAHEIQNPLNFVNNFSEVSNELLDEMKAELATGNKQEAITIADDVKQNLEKIIHHGKRADAIVKGMLQHSRTTAGQKELTDINALADEYLRLSYHGLRAKDKSFNATMQTDFDESIGKISIVPQDMGRVLLNLYNNAFYAVAEKKKLTGDGYEPMVSVSTKKGNGKVEIKVTDNGNGIPEKVVDKIFQPFFTTKPTGQGTGLGLSLSYDIIKAHGGELKVETKEGEGAGIIIQLPVK